MGSLLLAIKLTHHNKKRGPTRQIRDQRRIKHCLSFMHQQQSEQTEQKAKDCFLWFMKAAAYRHLKISKFKHVISTVLKVQKAYRFVLMRRMVTRALMDREWERFIDG